MLEACTKGCSQVTGTALTEGRLGTAGVPQSPFLGPPKVAGLLESTTLPRKLNSVSPALGTLPDIPHDLRAPEPQAGLNQTLQAIFRHG